MSTLYKRHLHDFIFILTCFISFCFSPLHFVVCLQLLPLPAPKASPGWLLRLSYALSWQFALCPHLLNTTALAVQACSWFAAALLISLLPAAFLRSCHSKDLSACLCAGDRFFFALVSAGHLGAGRTRMAHNISWLYICWLCRAPWFTRIASK